MTGPGTAMGKPATTLHRLLSSVEHSLQPWIGSPSAAPWVKRLVFELAMGPAFNLINSDYRSILLSSFARLRMHGLPHDLQSTEGCARRAVAWLLHHQHLQPDGGITSWLHYTMGRVFIRGSYPEVTGYQIPTLFDYAALFDDSDAFEAAVRAGDFVLSHQDPQGWFPGGHVDALTGPSVFNSGQVLHGLTRTYRETREERYLHAAIKTADWICAVQEGDGSWAAANYRGLKRVYDAKVDQALLELEDTVQCRTYRAAAESNLAFVLSNQADNGWFHNCDNSENFNAAPLTHTIGYTVQGLLECHAYLKRDDLLAAATKTLQRLMHKFEVSRRLLRGRYDSAWTPKVSGVCVTGAAQIALCWMRLFELGNDFRYLNAALKTNDLLKQLQFKRGSPTIRGALPASFPFWGAYQPYRVNSWGVKYFADAMMQELKLKRSLLAGQPIGAAAERVRIVPAPAARGPAGTETVAADLHDNAAIGNQG